VQMMYSVAVAHLAGERQGLTLVHFSAQRKRFLWDGGCIQGKFTVSSRGGRVYSGVQRVLFV
jgi:hypothetical protein